MEAEATYTGMYGTYTEQRDYRNHMQMCSRVPQ